MPNCRLCHSQTRKFLDLGKTSLPEEFRTRHQLHLPLRQFPLGLSYCPNCAHVQLSHLVPPRLIYKHHYYYDFSANQSTRKHWQDLAYLMYKQSKLTHKDLVIDIGRNSGLLLSYFQDLGSQILGVDPATRLVKLARNQGIPTLNRFFSIKTAKYIFQNHGPAKAITCTNTFDHIFDLEDFLKGVLYLLHPQGVLVIESPYLPSFITHKNHVVYHQQIDYTLLTPFVPFFKHYHLHQFDAQLIPIHGGSVRLYLSPSPHPPTRRLKQIQAQEQKLLGHWDSKLKAFSQDILSHRRRFTYLIKKLKTQGHSIAAIGASAKGITLLNYCHLGPETINFITETSPLKIGRFTPSGIPIVPDSHLKKFPSDFAIILAYNFKDEMVANLHHQSARTRFILPLPVPKIMQSNQ